MTIGRWFFPKCVNLRFPAFFHHLRKARRFHFQKLHVGRAGPPGRPFFRISARPAVAPKKSAREPRQGGSDYRCCIPALAGFVRPPSIAPDGEENSRKIGIVQSGFENRRCGARSQARVSCCIVRVRSANRWPLSVELLAERCDGHRPPLQSISQTAGSP